MENENAELKAKIAVLEAKLRSEQGLFKDLSKQMLDMAEGWAEHKKTLAAAVAVMKNVRAGYHEVLMEVDGFEEEADDAVQSLDVYIENFEELVGKSPEKTWEEEDAKNHS